MSRPWECPRCNKMNAPWLNQCFCGPLNVPTTDPSLRVTQPGALRVTDARVLPDGSFELRMDE
jgi:hypothetical protein